MVNGVDNHRLASLWVHVPNRGIPCGFVYGRYRSPASYRFIDHFRRPTARTYLLRDFIIYCWTTCVFALQSLSDACGPTFSRLFAQQVGLPPKTWLLRQKLEEAMRLLTGSNRSVTSVAYATGFSSCAHFSQAFFKHFGTYPSKLRGKAPQRTVHVRTI